MRFGALRWSVLVLTVTLAVSACNLSVTLPTPAPAATTPGTGHASPAPTGATASSQGLATPGTSTPNGQLELTPPPTEAPGPPTSEQLIRQALARGQIDQPTATLYQVWAAFGDPQLPAQYKGTEPAVDDPSWMSRLSLDHSDIPDATWAQLQPYVLRPEEPHSAFYLAQAAPAAAMRVTQRRAPTGPRSVQAEPAAVTDCDATHPLASLLGTANFRVAVPCTGSYKENLATVAATIDQYWPKETALMGQPIPDDGTGGSDRIDFYLVDSRTECPPERSCPNLPSEFGGLTYVANPRNGQKSSSFVIIPRDVVGDALKLKTAIVHEFWHVLEHAHNWTLYSGDTTHWLVEASASWAEAHFVPEAANDQVYSPWFSHDFQSNDAPLNEPNGANGNQAYRSFIWPYFMQQETGGAESAIVGQAWTKLEGAGSYAQADTLLNGLFSFDDHFADFAFRNINERLLPNNAIQPLWSGLDSTFPVAGLQEGSNGVPPGGDRSEPDEYIGVTAQPATVDYDETLKPLTSHYRNFTVANEVEAVTVDLSQLDGGDVVASALVYVHGAAGDEWQRRDIAPGVTTWCLGDPGNDIRQFKLVISNASYNDGDDATGKYSVTGRDACAHVHGTLLWTDQVTHTDGWGTGHGTTTIWLDVALKEVGPDTYVDDGSSYSVHGLYTAPDQPAPSIYDCAIVNSYQSLRGSGTFLGPGNYSGGGHLSLVTNYPSTGVAQVTADVSGTGHTHSEYVGPSDCAGVDDSSNVGPYTATVIWCKSLPSQVSGQETASGALSSDGRSIDMTCADTRTVDGGTQGAITITTVDEVTVAGTLYIELTDQANP